VVRGSWFLVLGGLASEVLCQVLNERLDLGLLQISAVLDHRVDDVAPLRLRVVAAELRDFGQLVARRALSLKDLLAVPVRQIIVRRRCPVRSWR
jgi:hypothetical protein